MIDRQFQPPYKLSDRPGTHLTKDISMEWQIRSKYICLYFSLVASTTTNFCQNYQEMTTVFISAKFRLNLIRILQIIETRNCNKFDIRIELREWDGRMAPELVATPQLKAADGWYTRSDGAKSNQMPVLYIHNVIHLTRILGICTNGIVFLFCHFKLKRMLRYWLIIGIS